MVHERWIDPELLFEQPLHEVELRLDLRLAGRIEQRADAVDNPANQGDGRGRVGFERLDLIHQPFEVQKNRLEAALERAEYTLDAALGPGLDATANARHKLWHNPGQRPAVTRILGQQSQ